MAWSAGPGNPTSVSIGGTSIDGGLMEGFNISSAPNTFDAASGFQAERGPITKTVTANCLDVSAISAVAAFMTARSEQDIVATYSDTVAQTIADCIIRVTPIIHPVTDVCRVYIAADGTSNDDILSNFTDLGPTLDLPSPEFDFPYGGTDGCGRPYYSYARLNWTCILPGTSTVTPYAALISGSHRGVKNQVAVLLPDGNFLVFTDAYTYFHYADEDGLMPRAVRMRVTATGATWGAMLGYSDGAASTPTTEAWDAAGVTLRSDLFAGFALEATGFDYDETVQSTFA